MAGFSSLDDLISKMTSSGQSLRIDWNKSFLPTTAAAAGEWHCLFRGAGNPPADAIANTGTNLAFQQLKDSTTNATGILHGGDVGPYYKHLLNATAFTTGATTAPCVIALVDLLGFYRVTSVTTITSQTLTNTYTTLTTFTADSSTDTLTHTAYGLLNLSPVQVQTAGTLPSGLSAATTYYVIKTSDTTCKLATSYANALAGTNIDFTTNGSGTLNLQTVLPRYMNGAGVQAFLWNTNSTALGAATPSLTLGYTNAVGTASRATPTVLPIGKTAAPNGLILYSGNASGKYGPFMPLQAGDTGISKADAITISVSYVSGEFSIGLCKPLAFIPVTTLGVPGERDFINQVPSLPRIYDGACIVPLLLSSTTTPTSTPFYGHLDVAWG